MAFYRKPRRKSDGPAEVAAVRRGSDEFLRKHGFTIFARAAEHEPVWMRDGHYLSETDAWILANKEATEVP